MAFMHEFGCAALYGAPRARIEWLTAAEVADAAAVGGCGGLAAAWGAAGLHDWSTPRVVYQHAAARWRNTHRGEWLTTRAVRQRNNNASHRRAPPPTVFIDRPRRPTTRYVYINFMCAQHSTACHVQPKKSRRSVAPVMATSRCHIFKKGQRAFYDVVLYCRRIVRRAAGCASWRPHRSMNDCYVCGDGGVGGVCHLVIAFHNSSIDDRARMPARLSPCCSRRVSVHNMQPYPLRGYRIRTVCLVCLRTQTVVDRFQ